MRRFSGHQEPWGRFVDAKINAPSVLEKQLARAARGVVLMSSVTDPYQPVEKIMGVTRACLETLSPHDFPLDVLTKSPLVLRDTDLLLTFSELEVGITVTTDNEKMRRLFEPQASPIGHRIDTLEKLFRAGLRTYAFVGPILPMDPERLAGMIAPYVHSVLIDRMNYPWKTAWLYRQNGLSLWLEHDFLADVEERLINALAGKARVV